MEKLKPPEKFKFPFEPYSIQHDFMTNLYNSIENEKLAIFESPTGTGKSLSIICGALQWLQDHESRERNLLKNKIETLNIQKKEVSAGDDWLNSQSKEIEITRQIQNLQLESEKINKFDEKINKIKSKDSLKKKQRSKWLDDKISKSKKNKSTEIECETKPDCDIDDDMLLDDFVTTEHSSDSDSSEEEDNEYKNVKIYFCSRTHSQLAQFVGEILHSPFGNDTRLVTLASRQNYCIYDAVNKLKNSSLINERCLDLQKNKKGKATSKTDDGKVIKRSKTSAGCPYMNQSNIDELKEETLMEVKDVEQLVITGKELKACPYYASRAAVPLSQIIVVPYNTLLHKSTREANGIQLKNNVVIIDEAHNLLDTIGNIHSSEVTGNQLAHAFSQLTQYRDKYSKRFNSFNLLYLNQVIFIIGRFIKILGGKPGVDPDQTCPNESGIKLYTLQDFVLTAEVDNLNIFKLLEFCSKSKINQKLHSFTEKYQPSVTIHETIKPKMESGLKAFLSEISKTEQPKNVSDIKNTESRYEVVSNNPLLFVISFMECLTNDCQDGRIVCSKAKTLRKGYLKFLLLNPAAHFNDIVHESRAVIVAGGTMQPISEFRDQLFISAGGDKNRIVEFSYDHIIPKENILPIALNSGPTGQVLNFSYSNRNNKKLWDELASILQNICNIIPGGVVCFFPSYDYENQIYDYFSKNGIIEKITIKKKVFREPKRTSDVDTTLEQYANIIKNCKSESGTLNGALMFSVVGGKLSEGLNFSDDLGRCVVLIGLPYPNIKSPELQEKMKYLNANINPNAGNIHYENLCMKAVNQCIGRAVRHKNDYASVLLLDERYSRPQIQKALPAWIQRSYVSQDKFGPTIASLARFFYNKKCN